MNEVQRAYLGVFCILEPPLIPILCYKLPEAKDDAGGKPLRGPGPGKSSVQNPGCMEDCTIHLSTYMRSITSQYQDPCKPISIMECDTVLIAAQLISVVNGICFIRVPFSSIGLELDGCFLLNKIGVYQPTGWIGRGIYLFPFGLCTSVDVQKPLKTQ